MHGNPIAIEYPVHKTYKNYIPIFKTYNICMDEPITMICPILQAYKGCLYNLIMIAYTILQTDK